MMRNRKQSASVMSSSWSSRALRNDETAWNSLHSTNKVAELKYRHVHPQLKHKIGDVDEKLLLNGGLDCCHDFVGLTALEKNAFTFKSVADLSFLPKDGKLIASEFGTRDNAIGKISVFDQNSKILTSFQTEDRGEYMSSFGITSIEDEKFAVCTGDGVAVWNVDGKLINFMTDSKIQNCCHITKLKNGLLAATSMKGEENDCVSLWDIRTSQAVTKFGCRSRSTGNKTAGISRQQEIELPWFIASDSKLNVHVVDRSSGCIKVYDTKSKRFVRQYDASGVGARCTTGSLHPQGITLDEDSNILVIDDVTQQLVIFDQYGELVRKLPLNLPSHCRLWSLALNSCGNRHRHRSESATLSKLAAVSLVHEQPLVHVYKLDVNRNRGRNKNSLT